MSYATRCVGFLFLVRALIAKVSREDRYPSDHLSGRTSSSCYSEYMLIYCASLSLFSSSTEHRQASPHGRNEVLQHVFVIESPPPPLLKLGGGMVAVD
ncbi:hypothetical protein NC653_033040 [Populus alba x Populus x berolinensis]|uniref:Secreted protein n=1 Tax=Populus alba x Populus x berolinensis TaxID=444605 RepID=A0AAD6LSP6_9ROSI|nr:hypothetical protein NC653_033040 [Populus alba x Populus x berolinensis]